MTGPLSREHLEELMTGYVLGSLSLKKLRNLDDSWQKILN
jgi:hypothetical protein